jgi:class 3 adenylate cyclase
VRDFLLRVLDIGTVPADDADLVVRKRTAVAISYALCVAGLAYSVAGIVTDRPLVLLFSVLQIGGQLLNVAIFSRTKQLVPMVVVVVALGMATIFSGVVTTGGLTYSTGNLVWGVLAPIGCVLLIGPRAGFPAYAALVLVVSASAVLNPLIPADQALSEPVRIALTAVNLLVPAAIALGLVRYIDGQRLAARRQSDALLLNVLPEPIADRLKAGERVIADHYEEASVLFADIVNFTPFSETKTPQETVTILNRLFTDFDRLADGFGLEKIKTIGDAYMVVAGVPNAREDHATVLVEMALAMHASVAAQPPVDGRRLEIRVGIASGALVAGVIGERKFSYDLWGDTVNTASRMESNGIPGCIQVTDETCRLLAGRYPFQRREGVEIKGKGPMTTWILDPSVIRETDAGLRPALSPP